MHHLTGYHVAHLQNLILLKLVNKGQHRRATPAPCLHQLRHLLFIPGTGGSCLNG